LKKIISILFLTAYLCSATQVRELLKLPVLFQHYLEHKQQNHSITFLAFLDIHYMHGSPRDADYDRDMQLPFKTCMYSSVSAAFTMPVPPVFTPEKIAYHEKKQKLFLDIPDYIYHYSPSIWQPPKQC
jgi:hypothetical protein